MGKMRQRFGGMGPHREEPPEGVGWGPDTRRLSAQSDASTSPGSAPEEAPRGSSYDLPCRWLEAADLQAGAPTTLGNGNGCSRQGSPRACCSGRACSPSAAPAVAGSSGRAPTWAAHHAFQRGPAWCLQPLGAELSPRPPPGQRPLLRTGPRAPLACIAPRLPAHTWVPPTSVPAGSQPRTATGDASFPSQSGCSDPEPRIA